jgi:hypothetical protein
MTERRSSNSKTPAHPDLDVRESSHPEMEEYAGGYIQARIGYIPMWLLVTYAVLFLWALYYLIVYWGGEGPGRI